MVREPENHFQVTEIAPLSQTISEMTSEVTSEMI
jgi:hypothetical protein